MPRRDGTGLEGQGEQTGRGLGPCGDNSVKEVNNRKDRARGQDSRREQGRGLRCGRNAGMKRARALGHDKGRGYGRR